MSDDIPGDAGPGGRGVRPGWRWQLILSLLLNFVLAGLLAGAFARAHLRMSGSRDAGFGPLAAALSRDDRLAMRDAFKSAGPSRDAVRADSRADYAELARLLTSDPFDRAAAGAVLDRQSLLMRGRFDQAQAVLLDRITAMTPPERAGFARRLLAALPKPD